MPGCTYQHIKKTQHAHKHNQRKWLYPLAHQDEGLLMVTILYIYIYKNIRAARILQQLGSDPHSVQSHPWIPVSPLQLLAETTSLTHTHVQWVSTVAVSDRWLSPPIWDTPVTPSASQTLESLPYQTQAYGCLNTWLLIAKSPLWSLIPPHLLSLRAPYTCRYEEPRMPSPKAPQEGPGQGLIHLMGLLGTTLCLSAFLSIPLCSWRGSFSPVTWWENLAQMYKIRKISIHIKSPPCELFLVITAWELTPVCTVGKTCF